MARKTDAPETLDSAPADAQRRPQGIIPRLSDVPHPRFGKNLGVILIDPDSLRVPKQGPLGEYLDDPFLALADKKGGVHVTQVKAEHAAEMLTCDPLSGGAPTCRLATDDEVAAHRAVYFKGK